MPGLVLPVQRVDNYEYELPSDFEDEEIDEDMAFTGKRWRHRPRPPGAARVLQRVALCWVQLLPVSGLVPAAIGLVKAHAKQAMTEGRGGIQEKPSMPKRGTSGTTPHALAPRLCKLRSSQPLPVSAAEEDKLLYGHMFDDLGGSRRGGSRRGGSEGEEEEGESSEGEGLLESDEEDELAMFGEVSALSGCNQLTCVCA